MPGPNIEGLEWHQSRGDGNCFYHSVAKVLHSISSQNQYTHATLRKITSDFYNLNAADSEPPSKKRETIETLNALNPDERKAEQKKIIEDLRKIIDDNQRSLDNSSTEKDTKECNELIIKSTREELEQQEEFLRLLEENKTRNYTDILSEQIAKNGNWATQNDIIALAHCLQKRIVVIADDYLADGAGNEYQVDQKNPPIFVHYTNGNHYNAYTIQEDQNPEIVYNNVLLWGKQKQLERNKEQQRAKQSKSSRLGSSLEELKQEEIKFNKEIEELEELEKKIQKLKTPPIQTPPSPTPPPPPKLIVVPLATPEPPGRLTPIVPAYTEEIFKKHFEEQKKTDNSNKELQNIITEKNNPETLVKKQDKTIIAKVTATSIECPITKDQQTAESPQLINPQLHAFVAFLKMQSELHKDATTTPPKIEVLYFNPQDITKLIELLPKEPASTLNVELVLPAKDECKYGKSINYTDVEYNTAKKAIKNYQKPKTSSAPSL